MSISVRTFEEAQAIGICWLHAFRGPKVIHIDGIHVGECEWCAYPQDVKMAALHDYNAWSGQDRQRKAFFALPGPVRLRLIREAQGYER